ncbi:MAG: hypothetical protein H0Z31_06070 [Bacillus sp. (in: Bacteria)]|nr:hypothetical protein [Bacillus sp. (in: firmicutes)]
MKSKLPKLNQAIIIGALISVVGITTACNTVDDVYSNDQKPLEKTIVHEDEKKSSNQSNKNTVSYDASNIQLQVDVHDGYIFDAEEPRRFILEYQKNADYYARIEVLDANENIEKVKEQVLEYLSHTGEVRDISMNEAIPLYQNTKFSLHASNQETAQNVIVKEIDGVLLKITIHYLNQEESEVITQHMVEMLQTLKVTQ